MVVLTFFLVLVGIGQLWLYCAQQKQTRALERPWVLVEVDRRSFLQAFPTLMHRGLENPPRQDGGSVGTISVGSSNYGRSPAWVTSGCIHFKILPLPLPKDPPYEVQDFAHEPLPPGSRDDDPMRVGLTISETEVEGIRAGRLCIALFGRTDYRDIFGHLHETRYAWTWKRVPSPDKLIVQLAREASPNWNRHT